ncbi:MAG: hypothetical protein K2X55_21735 [Burkholderiaceae bacterium]|nr:hypothetical protein [Burkholderiaceae bacterium]
MTTFQNNFVRRAAIACMLAASTLLTGCASSYLDNSTREVPVATMKKVSQPKPVHLVFEFQSKGAPNSRATEFLKDSVADQLKGSGLFSTVSQQPVPGAAMLNISLNNVPLTSEKDAMASGFVTGLTFGLAGSTVSDGYVCTASYLPAGQSAPVVLTARHAIHTAMGNSGTPANARKTANMEDAVRTMTREVVSNVLNDLSTNAAFN